MGGFSRGNTRWPGGLGLNQRETPMKTRALTIALAVLICATVPSWAEPPTVQQLTSNPYQNGCAEWFPDGHFVVCALVRDDRDFL